MLTVDFEEFEARLNELLGEAEVIIDWEMALRALREATGMPVLVGLELVPEGTAEPEVSATAAASVPAQRP